MGFGLRSNIGAMWAPESLRFIRFMRTRFWLLMYRQPDSLHLRSVSPGGFRRLLRRRGSKKRLLGSKKEWSGTTVQRANELSNRVHHGPMRKLLWNQLLLLGIALLQRDRVLLSGRLPGPDGGGGGRRDENRLLQGPESSCEVQIEGECWNRAGNSGGNRWNRGGGSRVHEFPAMEAAEGNWAVFWRRWRVGFTRPV